MTDEVFDSKSFLASLPLKPGVYRMLDSHGQVLYVGKANQLKKRVSSYFQKSNLSPRIQLMVSHIARIETTVTRSEAEALLLENNLIKSLKPRYNILFRDDKSYPYIVFTGSPSPRLTYYRGVTDKRHQYFGPYPNAQAAKESINLLQKVFKLRTCEEGVFNNRTRPCLLHQIHRCSAPCVGLISAEAYATDVRNAGLLLHGKFDEVEKRLRTAMEQAAEALEYEHAAALRDQLQALHTVQQRQFVESGRDTDADIVAVVEAEGALCLNLAVVRGGRHLGDKPFYPSNVQGQDASEVLEAFLAQHYLERSVPPLIITSLEVQDEALEALLSEQAGHKVQIRHSVTGERRQWLEMAQANALLGLKQQAGMQAGQTLRLEALRTELALPDLKRIECFDISHTMGEATVASCVVYDDLAIRPQEYRRYNISGITPGDDYAAMKQALQKRYQKLQAGEGKRPDLILIDGGTGQLAMAIEVMTEFGLSDIALIGVAKGVERKAGLEQLIRPGVEKPLQLPPAHPALHLIQQVRDEAHRFAITGHRAKRGKSRTTSSLEEIEGVGEKRRRNLLTHFGGLKGVQQASVEELARVEGVSPVLAEKIYNHLH
ncbi:MAG: excinuclease ABC subunit UvrC [Gammaproteobacteria bacterium]|nr:excinuclease ABC subunit UvrC [Gammaproteobacteria bacterium]MBU1625243.1 excinuclease ABC subunit UvrC [Gammaproteobacteria bacterium]MBU1981503.1 excinuclease ABC subunit UvrC [Gammaproteobacteria bacterium]